MKVTKKEHSLTDELLAALKAAQARLCEHCPQDAEPHVGEHSDECLAAMDAIERAEGEARS